MFGLEGDLQANGADDTFAPWKFSNPWFGTARGRVGYAFNNVLFYGTGGLAFGELKGETFGLSESHTTVSYTHLDVYKRQLPMRGASWSPVTRM